MPLAQRLQEQMAQNTAVNANIFGMQNKILNVVRVEVDKLKDEIMQELRRILEEKIGEEGITQLKGERGFTPRAGVDFLTPQEMRKLKRELKGRDGRHGTPGIAGKDGLTEVIYRDGSPDTPEQIADKINTLEERVEQKTIKGLQLLLRNIQRMIKEKKPGGGGGDVVSVSDLTSQTDGTTKTFTIPVHITGKTLVFSTQFPGFYRPTTDFTETSTSITLTSAVGAPQQNQTLLVYYVKG